MSYRSSAGAFEDFMKSTIWEDIVVEMEVWLKGLHEELEDLSGTASDKTLHRIGGNAQAIRMFMQMPERIRDNIKEGVK